MLLEIGKTYLSRIGAPVKIIEKVCDCAPGDQCDVCYGFPYTGKFAESHGVLGEETYAHNGSCYAEGEHDYDLIEKI